MNQQPAMNDQPTMNQQPTTNGAPSRNAAPSRTRLKLLGKELQLAQIDSQARKKASGVLEVLAGLRTPEQAAQDLAVSLPTYFALETRALRGLLFACTPHPPGRQQALGHKLREAEGRIAELQRQLQRHQALLRMAQHSVGLPPVAKAPGAGKAPAPGKAAVSGKRVRKKPAVRAMRAIRLLNQPETPPSSPPEAPPLPPEAATSVAMVIHAPVGKEA